MFSNEKVDSAFESLDLELEILSKAQQQLVMGGSGGTGSNGGGSIDEKDKLIAKMFGESSTGTASDGTFIIPSGVNTSDLKSALRELANTTAGLDLLKKMSNSGMKVNLINNGASNKPTYYDPNPGTSGGFTYEGTLDIGSISAGKPGMGLAAHELFHSYQDYLNGGLPFTVDHEVQGYIIQAEVEYESNYSPMPQVGAYTVNSNNQRVLTSKGQDYQTAMYNIVRNGLTPERYNTLLANFKDGSAANMSTGLDSNGKPLKGPYEAAQLSDSMKIPAGTPLKDINKLIKEFLN